MSGLVDKIIENGGEIYQNTKANSLKREKENYKVYTDNGSVEAKYIVIATHYPIINVPGFYFVKMYQETSYAIAIETSEKIFKGMYIKDEGEIISLRTAKYNDKDVIIIGGMTHRVGAEIDLKDRFDKLEKIVKEMYKDVKIICKWSTQDCITLDKIPYIGEYSTIMKNIYVGTGYKKWGMTTSNIAAKIITDKILAKRNKYEDIFTSTRLKPVKNRWEVGEMIKETTNSLLIKKIKVPDKTANEVKIGQGKIVQLGDKKVGIYKREDGEIYVVKPVCTHLGCELSWNNLEKTWDCPCHGSRFDYKGNQIYGPAMDDLKIEN